MNEWRDLPIFFCLLMKSHCILGFGNIVHLPFMPMMHTGLKMRQEDKQCVSDRERRGAVMFSQIEVLSVAQLKSEVE